MLSLSRRTALALVALPTLAFRASHGQSIPIVPQAQYQAPSEQIPSAEGPYGAFGGTGYGTVTRPYPSSPSGMGGQFGAAGTGAAGTSPLGTAGRAAGDAFDPGFGDQQSLALGQAGSAIADNPGYIDSAVIR